MFFLAIYIYIYIYIYILGCQKTHRPMYVCLCCLTIFAYTTVLGKIMNLKPITNIVSIKWNLEFRTYDWTLSPAFMSLIWVSLNVFLHPDHALKRCISSEHDYYYGKTASKLCARTRSQCPHIIFAALSSRVIAGVVEPCSACQSDRSHSPPWPM